MHFRNVRIEALSTVQPPERLTSDDIEAQLAPVYERLRLPTGRLEHMSGIRARHFWPDPIEPSQASAQAGRKLLDETGTNPEDIDLVMHAAVCRDRLEPATAAYIHQLLGLSPHTQIFDLSNACLGFLNALVVAGGLIDSGQCRRILICCGENGKPLLQRTIRELLLPEHTRQSIKPYFANLTIGAGAIAALITHTEHLPARPRISPALHVRAIVGETDSAANTLCQGDTTTDGLAMLTEAEALLDAGIELAARTWTRFTDVTGWSSDTPDAVICHQVGRQHQRRLLDALSLPAQRDVVTYDEMGNVGSVSLPYTLAEAMRRDQFQPGQRAALLGIGSGLSSLMAALEWPQT